MWVNSCANPAVPDDSDMLPLPPPALAQVNEPAAHDVHGM